MQVGFLHVFLCQCRNKREKMLTTFFSSWKGWPVPAAKNFNGDGAFDKKTPGKVLLVGNKADPYTPLKKYFPIRHRLFLKQNPANFGPSTVPRACLGNSETLVC